MDVVFQVSITSGNAAFGDTEEEARLEVARMLSDVVARLERGYGRLRSPNGCISMGLSAENGTGTLLDVNGDTVGTWFLNVAPEAN